VNSALSGHRWCQSASEKENKIGHSSKTSDFPSRRRCVGGDDEHITAELAAPFGNTQDHVRGEFTLLPVGPDRS